MSVMDTLMLVTRKINLNWFVTASTTLVEINATDAVSHMCRRNGERHLNQTSMHASVSSVYYNIFVFAMNCLYHCAILVSACQCYGHTEECVYDEEIDRLRKSIDIHGNYDGGGVCQNCRDNTAGINCDECVSGYYRPRGKSLFDKDVCERKFMSSCCSAWLGCW